MNFSQLKFIRSAVRMNFNLTEVASAHFATQSGVSRGIKELEDELGVTLFERKGKRLLGLSEPGRLLLPVIERMLLDVENIRKIAAQYTQAEVGRLEVATTHTQARYALVDVIRSFKERFPGVHLALHQGSPDQIAERVARGEADIGIATEALDQHPGVETYAAYEWYHCVIVPQAHPLAQIEKVTLHQLAEYPIVTYDPAFSGRSRIDQAFAEAAITADIVLTAMDADVIKAYVEAGFGIGIVASMAFDAKRDAHLVTLPADHLFRCNVTKIALRRGAFMPVFAKEFVRLFAPHVSLAGEGITQSPSED
jgi:LysR family transcriptional regulator, cys regulon transcriptional activator